MAIMTVATKIHANTQSGKVIINYPGYGGDINGYNDKYVKLADFLREQIGAVVRMENRVPSNQEYARSVQADLRQVIEMVLTDSASICGSAQPEIYLMGFSAGASAIAAVCSDYSQVTKLLLCAPSSDAGMKAMGDGLRAFTGEVSVLVGANDNIATPTAAVRVADLAWQATNRVAILPNCNHQFVGTHNGRLLSRAPFWAFAGDENFPSVEGSIALY